MMEIYDLDGAGKVPIRNILAGVYWELERQSHKALCCEAFTEGGSYYPRWVMCNWSKPSVLAKACWVRVCLERTVATRLGPFSP